ncbi:MAG: type II toxin-antitoxin system VapC family toxin [Bryobacteraceae bacterium]
MTGVDSNILVYAHRLDSPWNAPANRRLRDLAEGNAPWAIPWPCIHEFLAIVTHPKLYRPATPLEKALADLEELFGSPALQLIGEDAGYWNVFARLARQGLAAGPVVHDARIAAICLEHSVRTFWSADRDFSRFPGLEVVNPLVVP